MRDVVANANARGHNIFAADIEDEQGVMLMCMQCGAWATQKPIQLLKPCEGCVAPGMAKAKQRIINGKHPRHNLTLGPLVRVLADDDDWVDEQNAPVSETMVVT